MIKLIACDLDGTLLNSRKELPPDFFAVINKLKDVMFVAASGRQYHNLLRLFAPIRDRLMVIAENGALVWYREKILHLDPLDPADVRYALKMALEMPEAFPILCGVNSAYIQPGPESLMESAKRSYTKCRLVQNLVDFSERDQICKIAVHSIACRAEQDVYPAMRNLPGNADVILSGAVSIDVVRKNVSKGSALTAVCRLLQIAPEECMAFGDYLNDVELLQVCGHSYAMENAHPRLKEICSAVAPSNDRDGVMKIIRREFGL